MITKLFQTLSTNWVEEQHYERNLGNVITEVVVCKIMSEYRHKHKKDWFTDLRTVKIVLDNLDVAFKKHPRFVHLKSFISLEV